MNTIKFSKVVSVIAISLFLIACDNDDVKPAKSREIKFEVTGNFNGTIDATYITAGGGGTNEPIPSLPWTKSITYSSSAPSTAITVGGTGGVAGQNVLIKVFAGGSLVSETSGVANSSGMVVVASPTYIF